MTTGITAGEKMTNSHHNELSPKERVLKTINLEEPDRVPLFITITPQVAEKLSQVLEIPRYTHPDSPLSENRISYTELLLKLGNDIVGIGACSPKHNPTREIGDGIYTNEWKIKYKKIGYYLEMIEHPLRHAETISDVESYDFPEPLAEGRFDHAKKMVDKYAKQYAICGDAETTIFESSWYLVGMEKFLIDLSMKKAYVFTLIDRIMEYSIGVAKALIKLGADIIWLGDDFGTQDGMMISPQMWREIFKERMRFVIAQLKNENPDIKIAYHCCGSYFPIMPDLVEIGIDIFNALQPKAKDMNLKKIKNTFGTKVSLFGGIDIQEVLPFGSLPDIEREVKRVTREAAAGGGYILAGAHNIQPDTSAEKVEKLFEFAKKHGRYPIEN
jgi:uroporphyrinogen decarboxylase